MNKSVVIVPLGRFNPPHKEHENLVNAVLKLANQTHSDAKIFVSRTVDKKKNPLTALEKIKYLNKMFPGHRGLFQEPPANNPTIIGALTALTGKYDTVHIVLGAAESAGIKTVVDKYNGKDFTFDKIEVHSRHSITDTRTGDADGVHASDIRNWARAGDFDKVRASMSKHLSDADVKEIMHLIQSRLGALKESTLDEVFSYYITESNDEPTISMPSDTEMAKQIDAMSDEELDLQDSDVVMLDLIVGQDIEKENVSEAKVLSIQTRQKLAQRMKGMSKRLARLRQIKAKTMPAQQRLRMRARKAAIMMLRKRATGKKDLQYSSLSKSQRIAVDNALVNRFGKSLNSTVDKLSKRIMPMIRKKAQENVKKARDVNESFASFIYEADAKDKENTTSDKKGDVKQATKRGISVAKWEKSKADTAHDSPMNINPLKLDNLKIDPQGNDRSAPNPTTGHLHQNRKLMHYARSVDEGRKSAIDKDARDAGDTNIIYQMRKTINSRGEHETVFADKHKAHISVSDAKKLLAKFEALRMPVDKHKFTIAAGKSLQSFRDVMAHGIPKDKPKISLGGKQFNEFYLGVGRARTVSPYDKDEPPGVRNVGEVAKDEDRPTDPNMSRPLSQKLDLLLRLGLSDQSDLQKYRRALRSSKKHALQSPQMREALANLLDKLIDLTTKDPATYSRVRYNVVNKEANALLRKASDSGVPVEIIYEVFTRGFEVNNNMNEAFGRVNSFIAGGKAAKMDSDLSEKVKAPTGGLKDACWSGYTAVGMKMKNGRKVPNCVPKEETQKEGQANWARARKENERSSVANLNQPKKSYVDRKYTPMKSDEKERVTAATKDFVSKGGTIQKIAPGKKTIKSFVRPKKYMAPNQASRVTEDINYAFEAYIGSEPASKDKNDPKNRFVGTDAIVQNYADATPGQGKIVKEATYKGKTVSLNKPMAGDVKKSKVYVDPDGDGKAKKVNFGDKTLSIKKDQPARKRSYCARSSGQGNLSNKSSANYWSRRAWDC